MSGPTVVLVPVPPEPSLLLLSAAALLAAESVRRAAQAVAEAQSQADALHDEQARSRAALAQRQDQADEAGRQVLRAEWEATQQRWADLTSVAQRSGLALPATWPTALQPLLPDAPQAVLAAQTRAHRELVQQLALWLDEHLAHHPEAGAQAARWGDIAGAAPTQLAAVLSAYAQRQSPELLASVQRVLARVAHLPWPDELHTLVKQLEGPLNSERAQALLLELRHQVQAVLQREVARAQAVVLAHTLKDLGYELEEVGDTLFVEGGVMHLRKPGWGDYLVRLRVNAQGHTANFNVIRAVDEGDNERSVLDHVAEDRWCAEFPALMAALEARGLPLQVVRRLEAGELPVQQVARHKLPRFASDASAEEEAQAGRSAPLRQRAWP